WHMARPSARWCTAAAALCSRSTYRRTRAFARSASNRRHMPDRVERHKLLINSGLTPRKLELIGAITVLSAHTEQFAERASWALGGIPAPNKKQITSPQ